MEYNRVALKQTAKESLRNAMPRAWKVTLLFMFVSGLAAAIITAATPGAGTQAMLSLVEQAQRGAISENDVFQALMQSSSGAPLQFLLSLLSTAISTILTYGFSAYALNLWRGQPAGYGDIFSAFSKFLRVIGSAFMVGVFTFLWLLLAIVPAVILVFPVAFSGSRFLYVFYMIVLFFGLCAFSIWVTLRYAMVPYWIISDENCGVFEAIERSKQCMNGNKGKLFGLQISFVGWYLLGLLAIYALTFAGVLLGMLQGGHIAPAVMGTIFALVGLLITVPLFLWVVPYYQVATMGFFDLLAAASAPPSPPPFSGPDGYDAVPPTLGSDQTPPSSSTYVQQPPEEPGLSGTNDPWNLE